MDLMLSSRRILVTGASGGIGKAIAGRLIEEGCSVAIGARCHKHLQKTKQCLEARGEGRIWADTIDVRNRNHIVDWVNNASENLGGVDGVIAVPSGGRMGTQIEDWEINLETDILGSACLLTAALPHLKLAGERSGDAACVFISSAAATLAYESSAYGPIKAALVNLALGYARQFAPHKIRVNVVSPGMICYDGSGIHKTILENPDRGSHLQSMVPLTRFGTVEEVANAVLFLMSPLSAYTTGANLRVDGALASLVDF